MSILETLGFALIILLFTMVLACTATLYPQFKYYREVYKSLPSKTFYKSIVDNEVSLLSHKLKGVTLKGELDDAFYYFNDGAFSLRNGVYLHNMYITYFSPYSLYWLIKYTLWFKKNVDINTLEEY